jgi:hypothetical protein
MHTVVVPTLDTPMPGGKNVVWCASLPLVWNEAQASPVMSGFLPTALDAGDVIRRLNASPVTIADIPTDACYSAVGAYADGIGERIIQDMTRLFPGVDVPSEVTDGAAGAYVAFAYLQGHVPFTKAFHQEPQGMIFTDSGGQPTPVSSFGLGRHAQHDYLPIRAQVQVLYADEGPRTDEFVIDPCRDSNPSQLILACVAPQGTLAETLAYVEEKVASATSEPCIRTLGDGQMLQIPDMAWHLTHHFSELEGPLLTTVAQWIDLKLDRHGADVRSRAAMICLGCEPDFFCNRPFLLYMKKRGAAHPYFAMWVGNAELLTKL